MNVKEETAVVDKPATELAGNVQRMEEATKVSDNIVRNVPVCGLMSQNGYPYLPEGLKAAVHLYEGLDVYLNHTEKKGARPVEDKIGYLKGVRFKEGKGLVADEMVLNENHPATAQILWWAENEPTKIGLSHDADIIYNKQKNVVEGIQKAYSADIVSKAATVKSIKEGVIADAQASRAAKVYLDSLVSTAYDLACSALWSGKPDEDRRKALLVIYKDLVKELNKETSAMESWDKLTLDDLRKNRADIVKVIESETATRVVAVEKQVTEALNKVPEKARTRVFESQIRACSDQKSIDELVADRLAVLVPAAEGKVTKVTEAVVEAAKPAIADETMSRLGLK